MNKKKITYVLRLKIDAHIACLWFVNTIQFASSIIALFRSWTMKIGLPKIDHLELKRKPDQYIVWASSGDWNLLSQEIFISTKEFYVEAQIQIFFDSNDLTLIKRILEHWYFLFTYNNNKVTKDEEDFLNFIEIMYHFAYNKFVMVKTLVYL